MSDLLIPSFLVNDVSKLLRLLTKNRQPWAIRSGRSEGNEQLWENRSGRSPKLSELVNQSFFWANCSFAHFWAKNQRFARKTDEQIPGPDAYAIATQLKFLQSDKIKFLVSFTICFSSFKIRKNTVCVSVAIDYYDTRILF